MEKRLFSHMLDGVVRDFGRPAMLWQVVILAGALALAWLVARFARRAFDRRRLARGRAAIRHAHQHHQSAHDQSATQGQTAHGQSDPPRNPPPAQSGSPASAPSSRSNTPTFGVESLHRAFFPLTGAGFVWLASEILGAFTSMHTGLLDLAQVPLFGIGLIYIVFFFARRVFGRSKQMRAWLSVVEKLVSLVVWTGMALTVLGIQKDVLNWMDSVRFRIGSGAGHVTLLSLASGVLWVCVTMIVAVWAGTVLEERLMRASTIDANLKVVLVRIGRALLMLAAVLVSLSLVGIDVTVLGVFGGALGVGLGFGLQKIASNYVSGFIILIDRSLHLGDAINVGGLQGKVTQIRTRYTVVRGLDGTETLVPNERLITDVVQNQSSYLTRGYARAEVQVAYDTDLDVALQLLAQAASGVARVLTDPAPAPYLDSFGADGINLVLGYWIEDAANGTLRTRSSVNLNIWRLFNAHGISIPFTQREVRIIGVEGLGVGRPAG